MYNKIEKFWKEQFSMSANVRFKEFVKNLSKGGDKSLAWISANKDVMEMIAPGNNILSVIHYDKNVTENNNYFYGEAMRLLPSAERVFQNKFDATLIYMKRCEMNIEWLPAQHI